MAKKALVNKQQKTPKFKVRAYTPDVDGVAVRVLYIATLISVAYVSEKWHIREKSQALQSRAGKGD